MSNTANLDLERPDKGDTEWHTSLNSNMTKLDTGYGNNVATIADLPQMYIETGTFNHDTGDTITLPVAVDAINEYSVEITATTGAGTDPELIWVEKATTNFVVKCNGNNTTDTFEAVIYYLGDIASYGGSIYRRWYVSPDAAITDHGDDTDTGSFAWVLDQIGAGLATVELPGNKTYTITTATAVPDNVNIIPQKGAIFGGAGTLTFDNPAQIIMTGRQQIFGASITVSFTYSGSAKPEWWGENTTPATTDMTTEIQSAIDAFGSNYHTIGLASGQTYLISGTIYLGNTILNGHKSMIHILNDASFSQNGTATRRTEGAIMTKSAAAAGYGYGSVEININGVNLYNVRSSAIGTSVKTTLLLEQVSKGSINSSRIYSSGDFIINPIDFYANVKNFNVTNFSIELDNNGNAGGVWIRNYDNSNATENINFSNGRFYTTGDDEIISVYVASDATATVKNVNFTNFQVYVDTGATIDHIMTVIAGNASSTCKDINFSNFQIETITDVTSVLWVFQDGVPTGTIENVNMSNGNIRTRSDMTLGNCMVIRYLDSVDNVEIYVTSVANFTFGFYSIAFCDRVSNCKVSYASADFATNAWTAISSLYQNDDVVNCDIEGHVYGNRKVANCQLTDGLITGNRMVLNNTVDISNDLGAWLFEVHTKQWDSYRIEGNVISETFDSDTTDSLFFIATYGPTNINDNYYTGDRERFYLNNTCYDVVEYGGNIIDADGSGRLTSNLTPNAGTTGTPIAATGTF